MDVFITLQLSRSARQSLTDITSSYKPRISRQNDKAVKIMIKTQISL